MRDIKASDVAEVLDFIKTRMWEYEERYKDYKDKAIKENFKFVDQHNYSQYKEDFSAYNAYREVYKKLQALLYS